MTTKQQIYMVDALCGAGKTFAAIQHAIQLAMDGERVAIAQPTRELSSQSFGDCEDQAGTRLSENQITMIHSTTTDDDKAERMSALSTPQQY